jgi:hypothetical protein
MPFDGSVRSAPITTTRAFAGTKGKLNGVYTAKRMMVGMNGTLGHFNETQCKDFRVSLLTDVV